MMKSRILNPIMIRSLYLHFPFCETKCHYCDFYSIGRSRVRDGDASLFERAMVGELKLRAGELASDLDTVFLGGGTPSMTDPDSMERIFTQGGLSARLSSATEVTMEANPSSIDLARMRAYRGLGINRVSMGVQSLNDQHLSALGRVHGREMALTALDTVFSAGFTRVSTDFLCGVPGQTLDDLREHLTAIFQFPITHLSIYLLTLPPHHAMYKSLPTDEEQLRHLLFIDEFVRKKSWVHYEISNFARSSDERARHNRVYWKDQSYVGMGPSAHGFDRARGVRQKNVSSLHKWAQKILEDQQKPFEFEEQLNPTQRALEKWMLALRLDDGFPESWISTESQRSYVAEFLNRGYLEHHPTTPGHLRCTAHGFALNDSLVRALAP